MPWPLKMLSAAELVADELAVVVRGAASTEEVTRKVSMMTSNIMRREGVERWVPAIPHLKLVSLPAILWGMFVPCRC